MMKESCIILGGGGHARMLLEIIRLLPHIKIYGILDSDPASWGSKVDGVPVLGGDQLLPEMKNAGVSLFSVGLGSIRDTEPRRRLYELGTGHGLKPLAVLHPSSICSASATLGPGVHLFPGSIVNAGVILGCNVLVNSGAIIEHDCRIGDHVHVATGARIASTVEVGSGTHIGAGAVVKQCLTIGSRVVVGAGAVVVQDIPKGTVVAGNPARSLKRNR